MRAAFDDATPREHVVGVGGPRLNTPRASPLDLSRFPRRRYTDGATPLHALPRFSAWLAAQCPGGAGPDVWIKRDDLLGLAPGGNKTRKLEFLVADALAQGADTLVTCGAPQSNHCRITLAAAVTQGLRCRLVIEERLPGSFHEDANGNQFLFRLLGAESIHVVPAGTDLAAALQHQADDLAAQGRQAYVIPVGGSNARGGLGYVACAQELQAQAVAQELHFDELLLASGSAGTQAGLVAGLLARGRDLRVTGIGISRDPAEQVPLVHHDAQAICDLAQPGLSVPLSAVHCIGGYWQPRYSVPNAGMVEAVQALARTEAILLDPVYTGKAMAGLIGLARQGRWTRGQRVLFLHTGGGPALYAYRDALLGTPGSITPPA